MNKTIKDIGERGLLSLFEQLVDGGELPFNDDAVAFPLSSESSLVINIDTFVAQTDAPPGMTAYQMGAKTATMAISDLAAKGVQPQFLIASGAFPMNFTVEAALEVVKGIREVAHQAKAKYLGGDTNEAKDLILSVVAAGIASTNHLIKRNGAEIGDIICATGKFGLTGAGFKVFLEQFPASASQRALFEQAVYYPKARVKEGIAFAATGFVKSCIDSSDGLAWCLAELLRGKEENAGIVIEQLPIHPQVKLFAMENNLQAEELALFAGEEFELVFTVTPSQLLSLTR